MRPTLLVTALAVALASTSPCAVAQQRTGAATVTDLDGVNVVGRAQTLYKSEDAAVATRTDTPLALVPQSLLLAIRLFLREHQALIALHPIIVAAGSALAAIGIEPQPYKASKIPS